MNKPEVTSVTLPVINLNGSSPKRMIEDILRTRRMVDMAMDALAAVNPHGRDYHTAPAGQYEKARAEHDARYNALQTVYEDLEKIAIGINDQVAGKLMP